MTTIVFDRKYLATDSRATRTAPQTECPHCEKIIENQIISVEKIKKGSSTIKFKGSPIIAWAAAGRTDIIDTLKCVLDNGIDINQAQKVVAALRPYSCNCQKGRSSCTAIVVTEKKAYRVKFSVNGVDTQPCGDFEAIGSGSVIANSAHDWLGANAIEAVSAAITKDEGSGGKISYIDFEGDEKATIKYIKDSKEPIEKLISRKVKK